MKLFDIKGVETYLGPHADKVQMDAPTIVFLHGAGCDHSYWLSYADYYINQGFNVFTPDLPGHSRSKGNALRSIEASAVWLKNVENELGVTFNFIVGHSQGFLTGLEYAFQFGGKNLSLIGVASSAAIPVNQDLIDLAHRSPKEAATLMMKWSLGEATKQKQQQGELTWSLEEAIDLMAKNPLVNDLQACANYKNGKNAAARLTIRSLMLLAKEDKMTPITQGETTASAMNAEVLVIENTGHMLPLETLQALLTAMLKFTATNGAAISKS